jgi:hypothetical protein
LCIRLEREERGRKTHNEGEQKKGEVRGTWEVWGINVTYLVSIMEGAGAM